MSGEAAIRVQGIIVEALPKAVFRVELANGHCLTGFLRKKQRSEAQNLKCGDKVTVEISPFDFSAGQIRLELI